MLHDCHLLRDPGTPPVADSTVGIASTPSAIIVFNMIIVALILVFSGDLKTRVCHYSPSDRLVVHLTLLELSENLIILGALARDFLSLDRKVSGVVVIFVRFDFFRHCKDGI
jgi:hypothetical protein